MPDKSKNTLRIVFTLSSVSLWPEMLRRGRRSRERKKEGGGETENSLLGECWPKWWTDMRAGIGKTKLTGLTEKTR